MPEFKKICDAYEKMSAVERGLLLTEKSAVLLARLQELTCPDMDPMQVLAGFLIGSAMADGRFSEKEYLLLYPTLIRTFGDDFDLSAVKCAFRRGKDGDQRIAEYTREMIRILSLLDETLKWDVITLCLCVAAIDGRVTLKEKRYIRRLCEAGA